MEKRNATKRVVEFSKYLLLFILITGCSKKVVFSDSTKMPGAKVVVTIDQNRSDNYEIYVDVDNIIKAEKLSPPRETYIVWMISTEHGTINMGNLWVDDKNQAKLYTVSSHRPTRIFITAEKSRFAESPSTEIVLSSEDFKLK
ncbi:MAG TPA: hypothetical protein VFM70_07240 [Salinimicrobium sp.]|nr:hypothetical protein [Salinimicrobium sp.]